MAVQKPSSGFWETKLTYRWVIKQFSSRKINLTSKNFSSLETSYGEWFLICEFKHEGSDDMIFIGLSQTSNSKDMTVKFSLYLSDLHGADFDTFTSDSQIFSKDGPNWGFAIKKEEVSSKICDDILVIFCEVKLFQDNMREIENKMKSCQLSCLNAFKSFVEDNHYTDVVLKTSDGKEIKAHKVILAARSPVFDAMFKNDMSEKSSNKVSISDIDERQMKLLLSSIYGGTINNEELSHADKKALLAAVHKYDVKALQSLLEECLISDINVSNAVDLLVHADMYQCEKLKKCLIKFMCSKESSSILSTPEWRDLVSHYPAIVNKCFQQALYGNDHADCVEEQI